MSSFVVSYLLCFQSLVVLSNRRIHLSRMRPTNTTLENVQKVKVQAENKTENNRVKEGSFIYNYLDYEPSLLSIH